MPADPSELERALTIYKVMALPLVAGTSSLCEVAHMAPLSSGEKGSLETAIAAVLYQEGANLDAKLLLLLAVAGITAPRLAKIVADRAVARHSVVADGHLRLTPSDE